MGHVGINLILTLNPIWVLQIFPNPSHPRLLPTHNCPNRGEARWVTRIARKISIPTWKRPIIWQTDYAWMVARGEYPPLEVLVVWTILNK